MRASVSLITRMMAASRNPCRLPLSAARAAAASACAQPTPATSPDFSIRPRTACAVTCCAGSAARAVTGAADRWQRRQCESSPARRRSRGAPAGTRRRRPRWPGAPAAGARRSSAATPSAACAPVSRHDPGHGQAAIGSGGELHFTIFIVRVLESLLLVVGILARGSLSSSSSPSSITLWSLLRVHT